MVISPYPHNLDGVFALKGELHMSNILVVRGHEYHVSDKGRTVLEVLRKYEALTIPNVAAAAKCSWKTASKWLTFYENIGLAKSYIQQYRPNIKSRVFMVVYPVRKGD